MSIQALQAHAESEEDSHLVFESAVGGAAAGAADKAAAETGEDDDDDNDDDDDDDGADDDGADAPAAGAERLLDGDGDGDGSSPSASSPRWQSRWATVGSVVNTMMGTTIVALPFGLAESGVGAGLVIIALLGCVSCFTCLVVIESTPRVREFSVAVRRLLGRRVQLAAWAVSVAIILGAAIIYHVLMQETLFALVATLLGAAGAPAAAAAAWRREYAALVPLALLYPVSCLRDLSLLVRFNSFGFLFMAYVIVFIAFHGLSVLAGGAAAPVAFVASKAAGAGAYGADGRLQVVLGGTLNFASLGGMMMLSFFLHNCVQPIVKLANPATRRADVSTGYAVAGLLYAGVGVLGYIGFADAHSASECAAGATAAANAAAAAAPAAAAASLSALLGLRLPLPAAAPCVLKSNFLAMFPSDLRGPADVYAFTARGALLCQLFTVFPLLLLIIRTQVFSLVYGKEWPSSLRVYAINGAVCLVSLAFAATDQSLGDIMRFVGAIGGFAIVFAIPAAMDFVWFGRKGRARSAARVALDVLVVAIGLAFLIMQFI